MIVGAGARPQDDGIVTLDRIENRLSGVAGGSRLEVHFGQAAQDALQTEERGISLFRRLPRVGRRQMQDRELGRRKSQSDAQRQLGVGAAPDRDQNPAHRARQGAVNDGGGARRRGQDLIDLQRHGLEVGRPFQDEQVRVFGDQDMLQVRPRRLRDAHPCPRAGATVRFGDDLAERSTHVAGPGGTGTQDFVCSDPYHPQQDHLRSQRLGEF